MVDWSIYSKQDATLVVNALDMAIRNRRPEPGGIVRVDHGTQFTSWIFARRSAQPVCSRPSAPSATAWTTP